MTALPTDEGTDRLTVALDGAYQRTLEDFPAMQFFTKHVLIVIRHLALAVAGHPQSGGTLEQKLRCVEEFFGNYDSSMIIVGIVIQIEFKSGQGATGSG